MFVFYAGVAYGMGAIWLGFFQCVPLKSGGLAMRMLFSNVSQGGSLSWRPVGGETVLASKFGLKLVAQVFNPPMGDSEEYVFCRKASGATVIPVLSNGSIAVTRQFKQGIGEVVWEFPAGRLVKSGDPTATANAELAEETGLRVGKLIPLGTAIVAPRKLDTEEFLFVGLDCELSSGGPRPGSGEILEVWEMSPREFLEIILKGKELVSGFSEMAFWRAKERGHLKF